MSFLETGRSRPRTDLVLRLSAELALSPREQNALLAAAGLPAVFSQHALDGAELARYRVVIDSLLDRHEPLPAAVVDRYGAVVRANAAFERLTPGLVGVEPEELPSALRPRTLARHARELAGGRRRLAGPAPRGG